MWKLMELSPKEYPMDSQIISFWIMSLLWQHVTNKQAWLKLIYCIQETSVILQLLGKKELNNFIFDHLPSYSS